jgi:uncharacterized protein (TIGR03000 family)
MYGVVLMMALSGGADQPAWTEVAGEHVAKYGDHGQKEYRCGGRRRCHGGGGCYGGGGGCYGGGYGCYGGGYGCYGGGGYGCCGGGYGYGGGGYGSMPYAGGYYGYSPYSGATYAEYGAPGYSGSGMPYGYGVPADQSRYYDQSNAERLGAPRAGEAPATLIVRLPADAKLTIEGAATTSTNDVRWFISPPLQAGKDYQYTLKAEVMRDGKKVERTREVTVRAGQPAEVTFDLPAGGGPPRE